jgi:HTH-type transcriptional regulator, global nitrogen regulator NrpRI
MEKCPAANRKREEPKRMVDFESDGFVVSRMNNLTLLADLNVNTGKGNVILNLTCVREAKIEDVLRLLGIVVNSPYGMSNRIVVKRPGETLGHLTVPEKTVAIGSVCSITVNSVLHKAGIPVSPKFGGIVEIIDNGPTRFLSAISYNGSSVAPLEVFTKSRMTDILGALTYGTGRILGSFREIPDGGLDEAKSLVKEMDKIGIRAHILFGKPGEPLLGVPVAAGRIGMVVLGGLNPVAALVEAEMAEETRSVALLYDYSKMNPLMNTADGHYPLSRFSKMGLADGLRSSGRGSDYWSVFEGAKQSAL